MIHSNIIVVPEAGWQWWKYNTIIIFLCMWLIPTVIKLYYTLSWFPKGTKFVTTELPRISNSVCLKLYLSNDFCVMLMLLFGGTILWDSWFYFGKYRNGSNQVLPLYRPFRKFSIHIENIELMNEWLHLV